MSKRLIEVATELNVGLKTVVDFLTNQGFEVSSKPTAKVSEEMYEVLLRNFQKSIAIKEQADQIAQISTRKKEDKLPPSTKDHQRLKPWERPTLAHKEPKSLQNKPNEELQEPPAVLPKEETPLPPVTETVPVVKTTVVDPQNDEQKNDVPTIKGPKILGKINLDAPVKPKNQEHHKSNQPQNQHPKPQDRQQKDRQHPQSNKNDAQQHHNNTPKKYPSDRHDQNRDQRQGANNQNTRKEYRDQPSYLNNQQKTSKEVPPIVQKDPVKETPEIEQVLPPQNIEKQPEIPAIEEHRAETPQLQGLKILGKINIESTKKKKKKTPVETRNQRPVDSNNKIGSNNRPPFSKDVVKKDTPSDLTTEHNTVKPEDAEGTSDDAAKKKHRKKIKVKDRHTPAQEQGTPSKENVPPVTNNAAPNDANKKTSRRPSGNHTNNNNTGNKKDKKKEISTKEVQDSLKATMALMRGGNKRKKTGGTRSMRDERKERIRLQEDTEERNVLQVTEFISVSELAALMEVSPSEVITACMKAGIYVSINQRLDADVIELIAMEFDFEVEFISAEDQIEAELQDEVDDPADLQPRAPIVTVMGHVDHGKTSLLDRIRKTNVMEGEAGGITQHIGAYEVIVPGGKGKITFLDTPGHEAFTAMRARGAKVTDIAVIIVAADDSVMPQTREAISHAQAAGVPIIFAINKIDKEGANIERIKQELASMGLLVEDWGGKYQSQEISAKKGLNIDLLLEKILLEAEILELKANPDRMAVGTVLEASLEKGRGYVAKMLIQTGTLHDGDVILAGQYHGRVKAMFNERGKRIKEAKPSAPVLVLGLQGAPQAGEKVKVMEDEREAKELSAKRAQLIRQQQIRATRRITLDDINRRLKIGNFRELNLIVKCDMDGSVEALSDALLKLSTSQVQTNIVYKAVGPVTESDVNLAAASDAIIIGFQVRPNPMAKKLAEQEGVQIKTYSIIYDAIEEIKSALEGMLEPKQVEEELGLVQIQQVFNITKVGNVAGCLVQEGKITRNSFIRVIRNGIVVYPKKEGVHGKLASLKRFKDNIMEVKSGMECGLSVDGFEDMKEGDMIEAYEIKEVKQTLESAKKES